MAKLRVAEIEALLSVNTDDLGRAKQDVKTTGDAIEKKPIKAKVDADTKDAIAGMGRVEDAAKRIVSAKTLATVDTNIDRAEKNLLRVGDRLAYLKSVRTELNVEADISRAEAGMRRANRQLEGLRSARAVMEVDADTVPLEESAKKGGSAFIRNLDGATRGAGSKVGSVVGGDVESSLISALTAIPVAGGIILAGVAIGKAITGAIQEGMQVEVRQDRLQALTGIDETSARRFAFAAGEAYAGTFGDSIESNMNTARLGLQFGIIDEKATSRDAQKVIEGLSGISAALDEDVRPVATSVATLLKTGLAGSAEEALDLLATGAREGANRAEDLLDTFTEYPVVLKKLGLSGSESLGLINQAMAAGARNTDVAADALKEFQIRATDGSKLSTAGFERLGFSAADMTAKIARGGAEAREGLDEVLRKLRETEDPVVRNAAAVELFGTKAEDLGDALFSMDLSTAVDQLDGVTGSAQRMFDTLADNDATKLEVARRNIEVGVQGIQGALASAFSEPLSDAAEWISQNRGPMLQFFTDLGNGALDFASTATEGFGEFISGPLAELVDGLAGVIDFFNGGEGRPQALDDLRDSMREFDGTTSGALAKIEEARTKLNEFAEPAIALGFLNDAAQRTATSISGVGTAADGTVAKGAELEQQVRLAVAALADEVDAAADAKESQENLADRYRTSTDALREQLEAMGLGKEEAQALIDTVLQTPASATTAYDSNAYDEQVRVQNLADRITTLPDGSIVINADTRPADSAVLAFLDRWNGASVNLRGSGDAGLGSGILGNADGRVVEFMAQGGLRGRKLSPMDRIAQTVPANTWRVVGDRSDVAEAFIPLDGSARSLAILGQAIRQMPGLQGMADGGVISASAAPVAGGSVAQFGDIKVYGQGLSTAEVLSLIQQAIRDALRGLGGF